MFLHYIQVRLIEYKYEENGLRTQWTVILSLPPPCSLSSLGMNDKFNSGHIRFLLVYQSGNVQQAIKHSKLKERYWNSDLEV